MKSFNKICKEAEQCKDDMYKLRELWQEAKKYKWAYTDVEFEFIRDHIRRIELEYRANAAREEARRKLNEDDD